MNNTVLPAAGTVNTSAPAKQPIKNNQTIGASNTTPSPAELNQLVSDMQSKVPVAAKELQFSVDQDSGKQLLTLTNNVTKEVLWQVPSEVALRISKEMDRFQKGSLLNQQA
ncbi:flagellar protein FlaG [Rhodoferax sp. BLA1]|uniref:flagellar protein FlaG n=1 Tax=Rhodoferax sp. BLA1 TaxID=2576062 RepID=UPI0015D46B71